MGMATNLAKHKISTTVITDSAIFAMMARMGKVIMGTSSILADGTVVATSGAKTVALAAKHYSVPCIVLGAFYKLTPVYLPESDTLVSTILVSPAAVTRGPPNTKLRSLNPLHDSIPPSLVPSTFPTYLVTLLVVFIDKWGICITTKTETCDNLNL